MSNSIDQQFIEYIVTSLVGNPDKVEVKRTVDEKGVLLELTVDPEDLGRVIGKRGATAQSLRTLLRALGTKNDARYNLKIVDNGVPREERKTDDRPAQKEDKPEETADEPVADSSTDDTSVSDDVDEDEDEEDEEENSRLSQTRKELDDLDDLDI